MRLWTLHPKYLDSQGLVAVWREGLLAQKVLKGETKGYKNHPQLERFKTQTDQLKSIAYFLNEIWVESQRRNYQFDKTKFILNEYPKQIPTTTGQIQFEFNHLLQKLEKRSLQDYERIAGLKTIDPHPLFKVVEGEIESWEKGAEKRE